eukprot:gene5897-33465_t
MAILVMRIVSNVCQESNSSAPPGTNVYVRPFADAEHWRDILAIRMAEGASGVELAEVPALCECVIFSMCPANVMMERATAFAEELTGPAKAYLGVWAREAKIVLKDAKSGRGGCVALSLAVPGRIYLMPTPGLDGARQKWMKGTDVRPTPDSGLPTECGRLGHLDRTRALVSDALPLLLGLRAGAPPAGPRPSSTLFEFLQQLKDINGLPKGMTGNAPELFYIKNDWVTYMGDLERLLGKSSGPIFGGYENLAWMPAPVGGKDVDRLVSQADEAADGSRLKTMFGEGCSYCHRLPADVAGLGAAASSAVVANANALTGRLATSRSASSTQARQAAVHKAASRTRSLEGWTQAGVQAVHKPGRQQYTRQPVEHAHWKAGHKQECKQYTSQAGSSTQGSQ